MLRRSLLAPCATAGRSPVPPLVRYLNSLATRTAFGRRPTSASFPVESQRLRPHFPVVSPLRHRPTVPRAATPPVPPFLSMASLQRSLPTLSHLCSCSYALLHPRTRKISPRFPNGTFSTAKPFLRRDFPERGGTAAWRMAGRRRLAVAGAGKGPFFGGGRRQGSTARTVGNLAFVALVAYLAVSGQFRWLLDAIVSLWLILVFLPIVGLGALVFFARRNILQNNCPNCGKSFRILKTSLKNGPQFCPYCTQPFSVQDDKFVRESASFSSGRPTTSAQAFNELFNRGSKGKAPSGPGTIVDIDAEVTDIE